LRRSAGLQPIVNLISGDRAVPANRVKRLRVSVLLKTLALLWEPMGGRRMMRLFRRFLRQRSGATAIEYGLIAGLIGVVIIGALQNDGTHVKAKFTAIGSALNY
jgi:pilus assembly protein Flp/PilA